MTDVAAPRESVRMRRAGLVWLLAVLGAGAVLRLWISCHDDGVFWPDEVYQSLEPAHRLVFGYGLIAWEYLQGARSWALPALVAGLMRLSVASGSAEPQGYLHLIRDAFCVVGVLTSWAVFRLARALGASTLPAALGAGTFALMSVALFFAPRAMSETASAPLIVLGLALTLPAGRPCWSILLGASLLGAAVLLRLQSGFYCLGLLGALGAARRRGEAFQALAVFAGWAVLFGLVDRLTWGGWFHSAVEYLRFNVVEGKAGNFVHEPIGFYPRVLWTSVGPLSFVLGAASLLAVRRAAAAVAMPAAFVLIHSLITHKELRFLLPALALFCATAAVGLHVLFERARPAIWVGAFGLTAACSVFSALSYRSLTLERLGVRILPPGVARALDDGGPENRLLLAAHAQPDLCGLWVTTRQLAWTGGYAYLDRPVPLYESGQVPEDGDTFNYAIAAPGFRGGETIATDSGLALVRLSRNACRPDPHFDSHLH